MIEKVELHLLLISFHLRSNEWFVLLVHYLSCCIVFWGLPLMNYIFIIWWQKFCLELNYFIILKLKSDHYLFWCYLILLIFRTIIFICCFSNHPYFSKSFEFGGFCFPLLITSLIILSISLSYKSQSYNKVKHFYG